MGAEQSKSNGQTSAPAPRKTCYYELLGLERSATEDEIRKAYKKKALELHPDRNINDVENATRKFAEVQTAYEILSDSQERAWYDSHRDAVLSGDPDSGAGVDVQAAGYNIRITTTKELYTLIGRFNSSVPFNDSPNGFFAILDMTFGQLADEETAACEWDGLVSVQYPPFGSSTDDYETAAKAFYNVWSGFSTKKSFSWKDKYRLTEAPDRRIRRLMEKENRKFRDEAIRDFNDAVRSLVAFVKKRDPRYVPNKQSEAERQKVLRDSAAAQAARSRAANQEKLADYVVPDWANNRDENTPQNDEFATSEEESEVEHIECVVCSKTFKSEKQFEAHEKSKKHVKAVQQLRRQMKEESVALDLQDEDEQGAQALNKMPTILEFQNSKSPGAAPASSSDTRAPSNQDDRGKAPSKPRVGAREGASRGQDALSDDDDEDGDDDEDDDDDDDGNGDYAPREKVQNRISEGVRTHTDSDTPLARGQGITAGLMSMALQEEEEGVPAGTKKVGKAKLKREKKAARQAAASDDTVHQCTICKESFTSKTKMFAHINQEHTVVSKGAKGGKKSKR